MSLGDSGSMDDLEDDAINLLVDSDGSEEKSNSHYVPSKFATGEQFRSKGNCSRKNLKLTDLKQTSLQILE